MLEKIKALPPASFAIVMATGVVSITANTMGFNTLADILFYLNNVFYLVFILLLVVRIVAYFPSVKADLAKASGGAGFLTITAGTCVLGVQYVLLKHNNTVAIVCWYIAIICAMIITYGFLVSVITAREKRSFSEGINGSWLLLVVAVQSISILTAHISLNLPFAREIPVFISVAGLLLGLVLYIPLITLILLRLLFYPFAPADFDPTDWIFMGAAAITALASATIGSSSAIPPDFLPLISVVKAIGIAAWAIATWWIPILFILEIRKHWTKQFSFRDAFSYWSMVFPLGMYALCSFKLNDLLTLPILHKAGVAFFYAALAAWVLVLQFIVASVLKQKAD